MSCSSPAFFRSQDVYADDHLDDFIRRRFAFALEADQPPAAQPQTPAAPQQTSQQPAPVAQPGDPTEATLGVPIYPAAEFIASFDAGKGQRYYLFGTTTPYADIVQYYRNTLRNRGDEVFDNPPIHQFDIGRFREDTMAFPPSVTVKDYASGSSGGYLNPKPGADPARFPTVIQIVPAPR